MSFVLGIGDLITGESSGIPKLKADFDLLFSIRVRHFSMTRRLHAGYFPRLTAGISTGRSMGQAFAAWEILSNSS